MFTTTKERVVALPSLSLSTQQQGHNFTVYHFAPHSNLLKVLLILETISNKCQKVIDLTDKSPPEIIYSIAKKSNFVISNDTGPGHIAALSNSPILFLAKDNAISKSNLSEYKNGYTILGDTMKSISVKKVLDFLNKKKLIDK